MKISKLLLVLILAVAAVSCNKNDDNNPPAYSLSSSNFVDNYRLNFLEIRVTETVTFSNGTTSTSSSTTVGSIFQDVNYNFNANGTFTAVGLYNTTETVVQADGTTVVNQPVIVNLNKSGSYTLNVATNIVILNYADSSVDVFEITNYTETAMTLRSESEVVSGNSRTVSTKELRFAR